LKPSYINQNGSIGKNAGKIEKPVRMKEFGVSKPNLTPKALNIGQNDDFEEDEGFS